MFYSLKLNQQLKLNAIKPLPFCRTLLSAEATLTKKLDTIDTKLCASVFAINLPNLILIRIIAYITVIVREF